MELKKIKEELEAADNAAKGAKDGELDATKAFFRAIANMRAEADKARLRSEDQLFTRELVHRVADALEKEVMGS
jgi:hypothetical protein